MMILVREVKQFFSSKKNLVNLLVVAIMVLGLPVGLNLVRQQQIYLSRANTDFIKFLGTTTVNGKQTITKAKVRIEVTSSLGSPVADAKLTQDINLAQEIESKVISKTKASSQSCQDVTKSKTQCDVACRSCGPSNGEDAGCNGDPNTPDICDGQNCYEVSYTDKVCSEDSTPAAPVGNDGGQSGGSGSGSSGGSQCQDVGYRACNDNNQACDVKWCTDSNGNASPTLYNCDAQTPGVCGVSVPQANQSSTPASCIYSQGNTCYEGNCSDGSQNCSFNVNCGYVAGVSSGNQVSCPPGTGGPSQTPISSPSNNNAGNCKDNPVKAPDGYKWTADCNGKTCSENKQCPSGVDGKEGWCYGFTGGNRCLKLEAVGAQPGTNTGGTCQDNPVGASVPTGYKWTADCSGKACSENKQCPSGANNQEGWCYGFTGGNRCLKLELTNNFDCDARILQGSTWKDSASIKVGEKVKVGAVNIKNNELISGGSVSISGPNSFSKELSNGTEFTTDKEGSYTITAKGSTCIPQDTANLTVTGSRTATFKVAETRAGLASAKELTYTSEPSVIDYEFLDKNPGEKFIFVEFKDSAGKTDVKSASLYLSVEPPTFSSLSCNLDINTRVNSVKQVTSNSSIIFKIAGSNFGIQEGTVKNGTQTLVVEDWKDTAITARLDNPQTSTAQGTPYSVIVTRADSQATEAKTCAIGIQLVSLSSKLMCGVNNIQVLKNCEATVYDLTAKSKVKKTVQIDKDSNVIGLDTKLQEGKDYKIGIKCPSTLTNICDVKGGAGTTILSNCGLDWGDIAPVQSVDGIINNFDVQEERRQWGPLKGVLQNSLTGDSNNDNVVNSVDYSCMRGNFNKKSSAEPF